VRINFSSRVKGPCWHGYTNEEVDEIIDAAPKEMDPDKRYDMYQRMNHIIHEEAPWVFLYNPMAVYGIAKRVVDWEPRVDGTVVLGDTKLKRES
jgi:peptide/nickel transport system substrate-binding protein